MLHICNMNGYLLSCLFPLPVLVLFPENLVTEPTAVVFISVQSRDLLQTGLVLDQTRCKAAKLTFYFAQALYSFRYVKWYSKIPVLWIWLTDKLYHNIEFLFQRKAVIRAVLSDKHSRVCEKNFLTIFVCYLCD